MQTILHILKQKNCEPKYKYKRNEQIEQKKGDVMSDIWQQEKNLTKAAKVLGELKSHLHTRESSAKMKVKFNEIEKSMR